MGKVIDMKGQRYGSVVVLEYKGNSIWKCRCDCGRNLDLVSWQIRKIRSKSCRCKSRELSRQRALQGTLGIKSQFQPTHQKSKTRLYGVWRHMINRCLNEKTPTYPYYGGRGITIHPEWLGPTGFQNFWNWAYENGYDENAKYGGCTLDRIDPDGNYCPDNCRFITMAEQNNNKRRSRWITFNGETKTLADWSRDLDIPYNRLISRLDKYHWTVERAFTERKRVNQFL